MGVLECDRRGCDNIMCDRYSDKYGYICWECYSEMVESGTTCIGDFMLSDKKEPLDFNELPQYHLIFVERDNLY